MESARSWITAEEGHASEKTGLDRFLPNPDVRERHDIVIDAPASLVFEVARQFDLRSLPLVRAIFKLRAIVLGSAERDIPQGSLVELTRCLGWGVLEEKRGRYLSAGAVCQPWLAKVEFTPIPADAFAALSEPGRVKIAWTLEAEPEGPARTRFSTETRASGTDGGARAKFRRYWRAFGIGIVLIRILLLRGVRREAERRWRPAPARIAV